MLIICTASCGGVAASWLVHSPLDRAVRVQTLADIVLNMFLGKTLYFHSASLQEPRCINLKLGVTLQWTIIPSRGK